MKILKESTLLVGYGITTIIFTVAVLLLFSALIVATPAIFLSGVIEALEVKKEEL